MNLYDNTYDLLKTKQVITHPALDIEVLDLTTKSIEFGINTVLFEKLIKVSETGEMRPDLISLGATDSVKNADVIMKYNEISNPFSIQEGDVIYIPKISSAKKYTRKGSDMSKDFAQKGNSKKSNKAIKELLFEKSKDTERETKDSNVLENFKKKYEDVNGERKTLNILRQQQSQDVLNGSGSSGSSSGSPTKNLLPPNFTDDNTQEIEVSPNGNVSLGKNVAKSKSNCGELTSTKAEIINQLMKNRISKG